MDKDLLRIVIIAVGTVVILAMIIWGILSSRSKRKNINFYDDRDPLEHIDPHLIVNINDDDFDIVPITTRDNNAQVKTRLNTEYTQEVRQNGVAENVQQANTVAQQSESPAAENKVLPPLIQLSIVAKTAAGFSGIQLLEACENVGLVYGNVKVFEKLDELNQVDYAVASMAGSGIFPGDNWETYVCPGVTFFMQPRELDDAAQVFDEMVDTIGQLAAVLNGDVLDQDQQNLTVAVVQQIKTSLV